MTYLPQFAALADPTRLAVFELLAKRPAAVHEIAQEFPVSRPAISQHLRVLKDARLVLDEPVGTQRVYRLNPSGVQEIRAYFDRFWDDALESFKAFIEIDQPKKREISPCTKPKSIPPSARQSS
jgi:DNA-binding transcriptional ArsR family regulator